VAHSKCAKWHIQNVLLREVAQNVLKMSSTPTLLRATENVVAGHIWPAVRYLPTCVIRY